MLPYLSHQHMAYKRLAYSKLSGEFPLRGNAANISRSDLKNLIFRESGIPMILSSCHQFWMQLGGTYIAALCNAVLHVSAIVSRKQMNRTKACWRVAVVANKSSVRDFSIHQNIGESMCAGMGSRYLNFSIAIPKEVSIPQEAWI